MDKFFELEEFGIKMRFYRQRKGESITQVGEAVGVDRTHLSKLENGHERPSKQILFRLIRHYSLSNLEASELWNLAGYATGLIAIENNKKEVKNNMNKQNQGKTSGTSELQIKIPENSAVLYTDAVFVTRTKYGMVFDFAQGVGPTNERRVVSRIGMSMEHAQDLVNVIQQNINEGKKPLEVKREKKIN